MFENSIYFVGILLVVIFFRLNKWYQKLIDEYTFFYKNQVIKKYIESIGYDIKYSDVVPEESLFNSDYNCFKDIFTSLKMNDYCTKFIDNISVEMADVIEYIKAGRRKTYIFTGNFITLSLPKQLEKTEIILNTKTLIKKEINVDNPIFKKYFKMYSENEELPEYVSPDLIDFLANFRDRYGIDFEIIFYDKIYIRFFTGDIFEPQYDRKTIDKHSVYSFYVINFFIKEFIQKFNNNF